MTYFRILWVCIRNLGKCLCPRCLAEIQDVHNMGTKVDLQNRVSHARVDDGKRRAKIKKARKLVYEKGASANGNAVKNVLDAESMVPTTVRALTHCPGRIAYFYARTPFLPSSQFSASTISCCMLSTSCTNLSLVFGGTPSSICCAYCTHMVAKQYKH
jgi:hypothetical protein